jgi:hypothetical protein
VSRYRRSTLVKSLLHQQNRRLWIPLDRLIVRRAEPPCTMVASIGVGRRKKLWFFDMPETTKRASKEGGMETLQLIGIIFFCVCGGPYGCEAAVSKFLVWGEGVLAADGGLRCMRRNKERRVLYCALTPARQRCGPLLAFCL